MIRARGKSYQVVVYAGRTNGRDAYVTRTARTYADAKTLQRALADNVARGRNTGGATTTVTELLARWIDHAEPDLAGNTAKLYRSYIDRVIVPALGKTKLSRLTAAKLDEFYSGLRATYSPASIRQVHAIIRRACAVAIRWGWLSVNPAASASPPRVLRASHAPPDPATLRAFLASVDVELATVLRLAAASGLRRGELCALRWTDVDLELGALTVARALSIGGKDGPPVVESDTKTHQVRHLALDAGTVASLVAHRAAEFGKAEFAGIAFDPTGFVFTTEPGRHWHPDALGGRYRRSAKKFGLNARLHDWRHWSATYALDAGIPVRQVSARLGHASAAMTLDVYGHAIAPADRAAADALGALLDG